MNAALDTAIHAIDFDAALLSMWGNVRHREERRQEVSYGVWFGEFLTADLDEKKDEIVRYIEWLRGCAEAGLSNR